MAAAELVNAATSEKLAETDWAKNIEICQLVAQDRRQARDVVKAIKKRLDAKNPNTQFFAVMLLEMLMNIGEHIHKQVIDTGILPILVKIVKKKSDFPVREKIFVLLNATQTSLGGASGKFPQYYNAYCELVSAGVQFPHRAPVVQSNHASSQPATTNNLYIPNREQASSSRHEEVVRQVESQTVPESSIIQKAGYAIGVLKEVLDAVDAQHPQGARDEFTLDLVQQCSFQKQRVMHLIIASRDERIVSQAIELNEQLQKVLAQHDDLLSGRATKIATRFDHEEEEEEEEPDQLVRRLRKGKACMRPEDEETEAEIPPLNLLRERLNRPLIRPISLEVNTCPPAVMPQPLHVKQNGGLPQVAILPPPAKHSFCCALSEDLNNQEGLIESQIPVQNQFKDMNQDLMVSDPLIQIPIQKSQFQSLLQSSLQNQGWCQNPMNDPMSPYFLHPSESPGAMLISLVLTPQIYHTWARAMRLALKAKNKLHFIDGTLPRPDEGDPLFVAWDRCNTYVVSWINQTLSAEILQNVINIEVASVLWKDLKQRYYQGDFFRVAVLQEELFALKQGELSISDYFTKLKSIWEELENFRPIPGCSCGETCNCGLGVIRSYRQSDYVIRFLRGLNEHYANVRSQIMLMQPLPDINEAFSLLSQQERQLTIDIHDSKMSPSKVDQTQHSLGPRGRARGRGGRGTIERGQSLKVCVYCKRIGHIIDNCYRKHGFPPHMQQNRSSINNLNSENIEGGSDTSTSGKEDVQIDQGIVFTANSNGSC